MNAYFSLLREECGNIGYAQTRTSSFPCFAGSASPDFALDTGTGRALKQLPSGQAAIAAYIYNLLQSGQTSQAATAIAQAAAQGGTGTNAIATAITTASSQVHQAD